MPGRRQQTPRLVISRRVVAGTVALTASLSLAGCGLGPSRAEQVVKETAEAIADSAPMAPYSLDGDVLASRAADLTRSPLGEGGAEVTVSPLSWTGRSGDATAELIVRIASFQPAVVPTTVSLGGGEDESTAAACYRFRFDSSRNYDLVTFGTVDCPDGPAPPRPTASPPAMPEDVEARFARALEGATVATASDRVRAEFPGDFYTIEIAALDLDPGPDGRVLAAAVGIPDQNECVVGFRREDGTIGISGGFGEQILPGEAGCVPGLLFGPA